MPSPLCLVNNGITFVPTANGVDVSPNAVVSIRLADTTGVTNWFLQVSGTDELSTVPVLSGVSATTREVQAPHTIVTFTFPGPGSAVGFRSEVHGTGGPLATTFGVYSLTASNNRVGFVTETREGNTTYGWAAKINPLLRTIGSGTGLVTAPTDKRLQALATTGTGRELACATGLSATPHASGALTISVNGIWITDIGYGSTSGCSCYWSADDGQTAKTRPTVVKNDRLYWNGAVAEFELQPTDFLDFWYDVAP